MISADEVKAVSEKAEKDNFKYFVLDYIAEKIKAIPASVADQQQHIYPDVYDKLVADLTKYTDLLIQTLAYLGDTAYD